jgi:hypothetical protein
MDMEKPDYLGVIEHVHPRIVNMIRVVELSFTKGNPSPPQPGTGVCSESGSGCPLTILLGSLGKINIRPTQAANGPIP